MIKQTTKLMIAFVALLLLSFSGNEKKQNNTEKLKSLFADVDSLSQIFDVKEVKVNTHGEIMSGVSRGRSCGDRFGNFYLIGAGQEIYKMDTLGNLKKTICNVGDGPGEYRVILNSTTDEKGNLYFYDIRRKQILVYDSTLSYVRNITEETYHWFCSIGVQKNILTAFHPLDIEHSLYKYNVETGKLIAKCGTPDMRALKFSSQFISGGIDIANGNLYYVKPNYFQIYKDSNCTEIELIKEKSSRFEAINKKTKTLPGKSLDHSVLSEIYAENNFFIIENSLVGKNPGKYSIISKDGYILKENIPLFRLQKSKYGGIIKYMPYKYFALKYIDDENGEPELVLYLLTVKRKYRQT